ncbi:hypothetical protein K491DRAFT_184829 [Lophiostoma macrostomum CBS 122681]|uniref:ABM domain-containing protein n=1 Tax=Lophiostoma macrostomum CBS 122681 TaxID=1314788 RepID=A0A6A6TS34_9PLEO|nr:hypothetical protein K491DRAFT_184829 [Lophiostoma macrostomum CBS 122681]
MSEEETRLYSLHVKLYIDPAKVDEFLDALQPAYDAVIAEPECKFFEVYTLPEEPGVFKFVEHWQATKQWLMDVQVNKPYYKPYYEKTFPMFVKEREFELFVRMPGSRFGYLDKDFFLPGPE